MEKQQNWSTELYQGLEVHVTAIRKEDPPQLWDYSVRICEPGVDASAESELAAESGDDADYDTADEALAAGFSRGYELVDELRKDS